MPHYVQIKNTKTGRTFPLNADVWAQEKERQKKNKDFQLVELQPVKVLIPRRANVETVEKKSQDVAGSLVPNVEKALTEIESKDHLFEVPDGNGVAEKEQTVQELPNAIEADVVVKELQTEVKEQKKRGRPKRQL